MKINRHYKKNGFTLVEIMIVVICIGILAGIIVVSYGAISNNAKETSLKSDLVQGSTEIRTKKANTGQMPADSSSLPKKSSTTYTAYIHNDASKTFCLSATDAELPGVVLRVTETGEIEKGECADLPVKSGDSMQNITTATCPATRTMIVDGRDRNTYWIQKLADGKCWMLTNLSYAGGGNNSYTDTVALLNGTNDGTATYTTAKYYIAVASNPTTYPAEPTTTTNGGSTNPQYGYFYNWCAAMGAQSGTAACSNASSPAANSSVSICPKGWRLPTGGSGGELAALTSAIGATNNTAGANITRSIFLMQQAGNFRIVHSLGGYGFVWSSSQQASSQAYQLGVGSSSVTSTGNSSKDTGLSIRCVAI